MVEGTDDRCCCGDAISVAMEPYYDLLMGELTYPPTYGHVGLIL